METQISDLLPQIEREGRFKPIPAASSGQALAHTRVFLTAIRLPLCCLFLSNAPVTPSVSLLTSPEQDSHKHCLFTRLIGKSAWWAKFPR